MRVWQHGDFLGSPDGQDPSTAITTFGAKVDYPVRRLDHVKVVLNHHYRIAVIAQAVHPLHFAAAFGKRPVVRLIDMQTVAASVLGDVTRLIGGDIEQCLKVAVRVRSGAN